MVGLTATPIGREHGLEQKYLEEKLGFKMKESAFRTDIDTNKVFETTLDRFMKTTDGYSKLIYCNRSDVDDIKKLGVLTSRWVEVDSTNHELLKTMHPSTIFIVTKPELMRGLDYRSQKIELLVMRSFEHKRALLQGLGRVGRQDDEYRRFKTAGLELVDQESSLKFYSKI